MMSNWPPLVAMSVVTRWRRTFSSSTTQLILLPVFCSHVGESCCMVTICELFTVAMVMVAAAAAPASPATSPASTVVPARSCFRRMFLPYSCLSRMPGDKHVGLVPGSRAEGTARARCQAASSASRINPAVNSSVSSPFTSPPISAARSAAALRVPAPTPTVRIAGSRGGCKPLTRALTGLSTSLPAASNDQPAISPPHLPPSTDRARGR